MVANSRIFSGLLVALMLAGCSDKSVPIVSDPLPISVPQSDALVLKPVVWSVYDTKALEKVLADNKSNPDFKIFVLTPDGYKALVYNMIEIKRVMKQQKSIILYLSNGATQSVDKASKPSK